MPFDYNKISETRANRGDNYTDDAGYKHEKDKDYVIQACRAYLRNYAPKMRNLSPDEKKFQKELKIQEFVTSINYRVTGCTDSQGRNDRGKITKLLIEEITDYGILTEPIRDPNVYEIRINGREIKIEKDGKIQDIMVKDAKGNYVPLRFESVKQQEIVFRRILGDVRLTPKDAVVNASTDDGYRVAAVHHTALSPDPLNPTGDVYNAMVLRKFRKSKMDLHGIIKYNTISDNMAKFLSIQASGGMTFFTVGPTASGKTTLNNAILQAIPATTRTVLLQNPSEIDLRFRENPNDPNSRVYNDVLHLEAREIENPTPTDPTMPNLMAHILRLSPTFVCFGELRTNKEFKLGLQIGQAGHPLNCTFHAENAHGAITRYLTAYLAESGNEPAHLALQSLVSIVNMIIVQKILRDGTRKVIQITEVVGVDPQNENKPLLNDLYRFDIIGEPDYNEDGTVKAIHGKHLQVGYLSERTIKKLKLEGVPSSCYDFLVRPDSVTDEEMEQIKKTGVPGLVETYTGDVVLGVGKTY